MGRSSLKQNTQTTQTTKQANLMHGKIDPIDVITTQTVLCSFNSAHYANQIGRHEKNVGKCWGLKPSFRYFVSI